MSIAKKAFTVVELTVVIVVISILATITTVGYTRIQADARDTERASDMAIMQSSLETHYEKNGSYPQMSFFYSGLAAQGGKKFTEVANVPSAALTDPGQASPSAPLYSYPSQAIWTANPSLASTWGTSNVHAYAYLPYTAASALCQFDTGGCAKYTLHYTSEEEGRKEIRSRYGW